MLKKLNASFCEKRTNVFKDWNRSLFDVGAPLLPLWRELG
jgi:hypothetical protein